MRSWGRQAVLAQLWALMIKAIRTDPGSRSADQAQVVAWLQTMMNRKARGDGAQRRLGVPPVGGPGVQRRPASPRRPRSSATCRGSRTVRRQPVQLHVRHRREQRQRLLRLPAASRVRGPVRRQRLPAGQPTPTPWCFPPYQCFATGTVGCDNRQPALESFLTWGEAGVHRGPAGQRGASPGSRRASAGAGLRGGRRRHRYSMTWPSKASLGAGFAAGHGRWRCPARSSRQPCVALALTAKLNGFTAAATRVRSVPSAAASRRLDRRRSCIVAIAIAVMKGIEVAQEAALPGKLRDLVTNALSGAQNLQPMLTDQSDLTGLFGLFIRATGPIPARHLRQRRARHRWPSRCPVRQPDADSRGKPPGHGVPDPTAHIGGAARWAARSQRHAHVGGLGQCQRARSRGEVLDEPGAAERRAGSSPRPRFRTGPARASSSPARSRPSPPPTGPVQGTSRGRASSPTAATSSSPPSPRMPSTSPEAAPPSTRTPVCRTGCAR